jgi:hypothetical protein
MTVARSNHTVNFYFKIRVLKVPQCEDNIMNFRKKKISIRSVKVSPAHIHWQQMNKGIVHVTKLKTETHALRTYCLKATAGFIIIAFNIIALRTSFAFNITNTLQ